MTDRIIDAQGIPPDSPKGKLDIVERPAQSRIDARIDALNPLMLARLDAKGISTSELRTWAEVAIASGRFRDSRDVAQAMIKMKAGAELGLPPIASMMGIHVIEGKTAISAVMMAGLIQRSGRFRYRVTRLTDEDPKPPKTTEPAGCTIEFYEQISPGVWESCGVPSTFTTADALKAGLLNKDNWRKWRRNMLFGRALSNGARWYCASIFQGAPVYVSEELGAVVNEDGDFVEAPPPHRGEEPEVPLVPGAPDLTSVEFVTARLTQLFGLRWTNSGALTAAFFGEPVFNATAMQELREHRPDVWLAGCAMLAEQEA